MGGLITTFLVVKISLLWGGLSAKTIGRKLEGVNEECK